MLVIYIFCRFRCKTKGNLKVTLPSLKTQLKHVQRRCLSNHHWYLQMYSVCSNVQYFGGFCGESALKNIYDQFILPLIFALKIYAVHCSKAHVESKHAKWTQVNINTRFEKNNYSQINWNVQTYKANLMRNLENKSINHFHFI